MAKVFIAEDEPEIQRLLRDMLKHMGHKVVFIASTFNEAVQMAEQSASAEIEVAIVDGTISLGSDGERVAKILRAKVSGVKIIGCSAYVVSFGDVNLQKPVGTNEIRQALAKLGF